MENVYLCANLARMNKAMQQFEALYTSGSLETLGHNPCHVEFLRATISPPRISLQTKREVLF